MATFGTSDVGVLEFLAPMWVEISFMLVFLVAFAIVPRSKGGSKLKKVDDAKSRRLHKQIGADVEAGQSGAAFRTWLTAKSLAPTPLETLKTVVQVILATKPEALISEMIEHFTAHSTLNNAKSVIVVLDVVARTERVDLLDELAHEFRHKLLIQPNAQTYEVLLGGHASVGDESGVSQLCVEMRESRLKLTARSYSLTIKGFLKNGMVDAALGQIQEMCRCGFFVPSFAVAQLFRTACQHDRGEEIFEATLRSKSLQLPSDAIVVLIEDCQKRNDLSLARRVHQVAMASKIPLLVSAYEALLKICVVHADIYALELFQNMQHENVSISEGLCVGLLARCADSKFLCFAEAIVSFVRGQAGMTIACYSAYMKVYAYCGMYDKACNLYAQIRADGLEPDSIMCGCLMKFSVQCGRTELSRELFNKSPALDIGNYMSLIKAAGRDKDVSSAFAVLEKLKTSNVAIDVAAYNCVLDVCVSAGDMTRARALVEEMQTMASLDLITYNTLLKGYCSKRDVGGAKNLLLEMERAGHAPNDVSYNCLVNAAVSSGNFREAWDTIDKMERSGVVVDRYTISIMMKALKWVKDPKDVGRTLELLDRSGVDVCSDEVLLNTVLETCTRHRQLHRLESIIALVTSSSLRPSVHTYGSLIKACSSLKRMDTCQELWHRMVEQCGMQPNEVVLGCMLDALVCNEKVEDAVTLLKAWKTTITPNTVMYSTIIKGFANNRQADRALDMWKEMVELGVKFNIVVYNALVDSQARVGAMDEVSKVVESMGPNGCSPDNITYSTIVKGYCVKGDVDKAFEVFQRMQTNGMAGDSIVYNTIMDGCTRHNRMDLVDLVLEDMNKHNIKPSCYTLGILIKMYGRRHQLDKAFQVMEQIPKRHGLQVNTQVRTCLMCACLSNHESVRALKVFDDIKVADGSADSKVHSSLLSGLVRLGHLDKAVALVESAYGLGEAAQRRLPRGQVLDPEALEQLVRTIGQRHLMESMGTPLLERLRAARVPISGRLLSLSLRTGQRN